MKGRQAVALLALAAAIAGCSLDGATAEPKGTPITIRPKPQQYAGSSTSMPLDAYRLGSADMKRLESAVYTLASACMEEFGLSWPPPADADGPATADSRRYGVADERFVAKFGYSPPAPDDMTWDDIAKAGEESRKRTAAIPEVTRKVYTGEGVRERKGRQVPEGGCRGEAYRKIGMKDLEVPYDSEMDRIELAEWKRARKSEIVERSAAEWRLCMEERGFQYKSPEEVIERPRWASEDKPPSWVDMTKPSQEEIDTAKADVHCKKSALFVETWQAVEIRNQRVAIEENGDLMRRAKTAVADVKSAVEDTLASP
jgi:hypothetical protein